MKHSVIWYLVTNPTSRKRLPQTPGAGGEAHYSGRGALQRQERQGCRVEKRPSRKWLASLADLSYWPALANMGN